MTLARQLYHLPYYEARISVTPTSDSTDIGYVSVRTHDGAPSAELRCRYGPIGSPFTAAIGSLDHWLVERYALYAVNPEERLLRAEIDHAPWELRRAEAEFMTNTLASAAGITLPDQPPLLHFARRLEVVAWTPREVEAETPG